jgi:CRISPR-associated endonuclease/helicase Cas3
MKNSFIAHTRKLDGAKQTVSEHLEGVSEYCRTYASKLGLSDIGELLGLLHDIGKYSSAFQTYLKSANGLINPDEDTYVDSTKLKGKIDHSTAGAQLLWQYFSGKEPQIKFFAKILSLCLVSHHSGLLDTLSPEGIPTLLKRINKSSELTHLDEILTKYDTEIKEKIINILKKPELPQQLILKIKGIKAPKGAKKIELFKMGLLVRFLYSCLIDADRTDSCVFERPYTKKILDGVNFSWGILISRLETEMEKFKKTPKPVDIFRNQVSDYCKTSAEKEQGVFTLTVPTGGGKTLASLRFALYHAKKHNLDRIIYVVPFTTVIDQNAEEVRKILEPETEPYSSIVLEHHSNLTPDEETYQNKILSENWNAPIIFTTSVQLLETLFGGGTRSVRRTHQLIKSLIIFDEAQALPLRCIHMLNNSINFLVESCGSSIVLCTATQPLLNRVDPLKGSCSFDKKSEIIPDIKTLFSDLKRVSIFDYRKSGGCSDEEISKYAIKEMSDTENCLIITNTKKNALRLYNKISLLTATPVYHLSTDMCPSHRRSTLAEIKKDLKNKSPLICVSTQLIEAGIDIDFNSVIRYIAGIDSIAQAAGRCNRHGLKKIGRVLIVNCKDENLSKLPDIKKGKEVAERILDELKETDSKDIDLLAPTILERFFHYYFFDRKSEMSYKVKITERDDCLLDLLSDNKKSLEEHKRITGKYPEEQYLNHSFTAAGNIFKAFDAPTCGIVVPSGQEGKEIIGLLGAAFDLEKQFKLLKRAQQYSVNLFPNRFEKLLDIGAIKEIQKDSGIYFLDSQYYDKNFGVCSTIVNDQEILIE